MNVRTSPAVNVTVCCEIIVAVPTASVSTYWPASMFRYADAFRYDAVASAEIVVSVGGGVVPGVMKTFKVDPFPLAATYGAALMTRNIA
jgi:hypothetical protein